MRKILALLFGLLASPAFAADNYNATPGTGLVFGAKDATSIYYPRHILCDNTTVAQCLAIDSSGRLTFVPNTAVNIGQINGVTQMMGQGATGTGSPRVTIANDNTVPTGWPTAANQTIVNTWAGGTLGAMANYGTSPGAVLVPGANVFVTNTLAAVGNNVDDVAAAAANSSPVVSYNYVWDSVGGNWDRQPKSTTVANPCESNTQSYATGVITSATTTRIIAPSASNKTYFCTFFIKASAADNAGVVEGTGGTCGTATAALLGGTTAANGLVLATGDGLFMQAGGKTAVMQTAGTNVDSCLITTTAGPLIWSAKYVQAP